MTKKLKIILYVTTIAVVSLAVFFISTYPLDIPIFRKVQNAEVGQEIVLKKGDLVKISGTGIVLGARFVESGYTSWDRMGPHVILEVSVDGKKFETLYWATNLGDYYIGDTETDDLTYIKLVVRDKRLTPEQLPE